MDLCPRRTKKLFGLINWPDNHAFLITNAFYTLEDPNMVDVIKTCSSCQAKQALSMDKQTLIETSLLFPAAFDPLVREYIQSWGR